ncbi:unnamed protein product [Darwinula stevensoni]|uniref:Uncharacterized protein n=1 Tax=Darwinula stevensoni TaxID=69355 RepID=A0A7R8X9E3_9CRUS|nr:unnamed protein product [Darwinula stevensoni]CAG0889572.1 unnamed protein product [Darwinula stevensoni]
MKFLFALFALCAVAYANPMNQKSCPGWLPCCRGTPAQCDLCIDLCCAISHDVQSVSHVGSNTCECYFYNCLKECLSQLHDGDIRKREPPTGNDILCRDLAPPSLLYWEQVFSRPRHRSGEAEPAPDLLALRSTDLHSQVRQLRGRPDLPHENIRGESGGPLVVYVNGIAYAMGVDSHRVSICGLLPVRYTRVTADVVFIYDAVLNG